MGNESIHTNGASGGGGATDTPTTDLPTASTSAPTTQARPGGARARVYLNEKVVPSLLEGMKVITKEQPPNPLRVLGEFLIQKSNEIEGGAAGSNNKSPD